MTVISFYDSISTDNPEQVMQTHQHWQAYVTIDKDWAARYGNFNPNKSYWKWNDFVDGDGRTVLADDEHGRPYALPEQCPNHTDLPPSVQLSTDSWVALPT